MKIVLEKYVRIISMGLEKIYIIWKKVRTVANKEITRITGKTAKNAIGITNVYVLNLIVINGFKLIMKI